MTTLISCTEKIKYKIIHEPINLDLKCFEYTDKELDQMTEDVGKRTYINAVKCDQQRIKNNKIIKKHNELHDDL